MYVHVCLKSMSPLQKFINWRMMNQARGYVNYMQVASANQKQQEIKLRPMKKHSLKIGKVKLCRENLLLKHICNQCFEMWLYILSTASGFLGMEVLS